MNVLSIGNSFSQDAQRYLYGIARSAGVVLHSFNLYIGGCPLSTHFRNIKSEKNEYTLEMNGISTGFKISIKEALLSRDWDYITVQQASGKSVNYDTYQPYLSTLSDYIREYAPKAKLVIHQTWGYEDGSFRLTEEMKYESYNAMFADIKASYAKAAVDTDAHMLIPSGEVMEALISKGLKVHRDTFHLSLALGRYAAGLTWFKMLTKKDISAIPFSDFDAPLSDEEIYTVKETVNEICGKHLA